MNSRQLHRWFHQINKDIFNGELPTPRITAVSLPQEYLGFCDEKSNGKYELIVSDAYMDGMQLSTLAHEMIHLWQFENGLTTSHGKEFKQWAKLFKVHYGWLVL